MAVEKGKVRPKLLAMATSIVLILVIVLLAEAYCRLFTRITFLDNSAGVFTPNRFGTSYGNTPNFEGISFGERFVTDSNGFRIDPNFKQTLPPDAPALLIISDSVGFGTGVEDSKTIAGHLRSGMPNQRIENASVIGYDTQDYQNAASQIIGSRPDIKTVVMLFCLNDVNDTSALQIREEAGDTGSKADNRSIARRANDYLRSRSKLFLLIKNLTRDTPLNTFEYDLNSYKEGSEDLEASLKAVVDLKKLLVEKGIAFKVFVLPYEAQLRRTATEADLKPQRMLDAYFKENGIESYDFYPEFKAYGERARYLFLYGDPMHLNEEGHAMVAQLICKNLPGCSLSK